MAVSYFRKRKNDGPTGSTEEGLSNLQYEVLKSWNFPLYTWVLINIVHPLPEDVMDQHDIDRIIAANEGL